MLFGYITLTLWVLTVVGWVIYNLYQKNIKLEELEQKERLQEN